MIGWFILNVLVCEAQCSTSIGLPACGGVRWVEVRCWDFRVCSILNGLCGEED